MAPVGPPEYYRRNTIAPQAQEKRNVQAPEEHTPQYLVSIEELIYESTRPIDWLIEDVYPVGEIVLMAGASHSGKTYTALDQGLAVAYGAPWLGIYDTKRTPVIYAPSEGRRGIGKRLRAAIEFHQPYSQLPPFHLFSERLNLVSGDSFKHLVQMQEETGSQFVIVDVLRDATPGIAENSDEMGDMFGRLRDFSAHSGATLLVLHHLGKDASKGARGHSSIKDKTDIEVIVTASEIRSETFRRTTIRLDTTKNRNYDSAEISLILTRPNETFVAPVIIGADNPQNTGIIVREAYLTMLKAFGRVEASEGDRKVGSLTTVAELVEATGHTKPTVTDTLKAMQPLGLVQVDKSGKAHLWSVTKKGRKAIVRQPEGTQTDGGISEGRGQHPIGAGHPYEPNSGRPTVIEELLEQARQDDEPDKPEGAEVTRKVLGDLLALVDGNA